MTGGERGARQFAHRAAQSDSILNAFTRTMSLTLYVLLREPKYIRGMQSSVLSVYRSPLSSFNLEREIVVI